ncbi:MAG: YveK family protein [Enterococcus sp.]
MEETISLKEIFDVLKKRVGLIIVSAVIVLGISGGVTYFLITPMYSSQAQLIVTLPQSEATNANDVDTNLQMINTYKDLITGDLVMNDVTERLEKEYDLTLDVETIRDSTEVTQSENSQMFSIIATNENPKNAEHIANTTAEVFQENAKDVMNVDKISIISNATPSIHPVSPNNKLNLVIGVLIGGMIGVGIAFLLELLDRTVKDDKFVTESLEFTVLGIVPQMSEKEVETTTINHVKKSEMKDIETRGTDDLGFTNTRRSRSRV